MLAMLALALALVPLPFFLLLPETNHLGQVGSCCLGKCERAACCHRGARIRASWRWKTGGRQG